MDAIFPSPLLPYLSLFAFFTTSLDEEDTALAWWPELTALPTSCRKSRSYQQSSWSVFDQAKTLSFSAVIKLFSAVL
jgi:hypothetical protein